MLFVIIILKTCNLFVVPPTVLENTYFPPKLNSTVYYQLKQNVAMTSSSDRDRVAGIRLLSCHE